MCIYNIIQTCKYIVFTILIIISPLISISQQFSGSGLFQYVNNSNNSDVYTAINFIDTNTREIRTSFNLVGNNPFNKLDYPELEKNNYDQPNNRYDLGGIPLNEIKIDGCNIIIGSGEDLTKKYSELVGRNFYYASVSGNNLVVHYLFYLNIDDIVIGRSDAIFIFNGKGEILHKLQEFDTNVTEWGLTENGRYFSYAYGGVLDESMTSFSTVGYKVIDLDKETIVFQEDFGYKFNEIRTRNFRNIIRVTCFSVVNNYIFIDFEKNKKYSKDFNRQEKSLWKEITENGIIIHIGNVNSNTYKLLKFENDFKVEELK